MCKTNTKYGVLFIHRIVMIQIKLSPELFNSNFALKIIQLCCQTLILPQHRLTNI